MKRVLALAGATLENVLFNFSISNYVYFFNLKFYAFNFKILKLFTFLLLIEAYRHLCVFAFCVCCRNEIQKPCCAAAAAAAVAAAAGLFWLFFWTLAGRRRGCHVSRNLSPISYSWGGARWG